jgi:hypothetical protein
MTNLPAKTAVITLNSHELSTTTSAAGYCTECGRCTCNCSICVRVRGRVNFCVLCHNAQTAKAVAKKAGA